MTLHCLSQKPPSPQHVASTFHFSSKLRIESLHLLLHKFIQWPSFFPNCQVILYHLSIVLTYIGLPFPSSGLQKGTGKWRCTHCLENPNLKMAYSVSTHILLARTQSSPWRTAEECGVARQSRALPQFSYYVRREWILVDNYQFSSQCLTNKLSLR